MSDIRDEREALLESATGAWRERNAAGLLLPAPAWMDLDAAGRDELFQRQWLSRRLERAYDPAGLNGTARAVTSRARALAQLAPGEE